MKRTIVNQESIDLCGVVVELPKSKDDAGHYLDILEAMAQQLRNLLTYTDKLCLFRFDLHVAQWSSGSSEVSRFLAKVKQVLKSKSWKHNRVGHAWCREQTPYGYSVNGFQSANQQHYHCVLILDAHITQNSKSLMPLIERIWKEELGQPRVWRNDSRILRRGDDKTFGQVMEWLSYLAKVSSKELTPEHAKSYSVSRIRPKSHNRKQVQPNKRFSDKVEAAVWVL